MKSRKPYTLQNRFVAGPFKRGWRVARRYATAEERDAALVDIQLRFPMFGGTVEYRKGNP